MQVFSYEICGIFKNFYLIEHLQTIASAGSFHTRLHKFEILLIIYINQVSLNIFIYRNHVFLFLSLPLVFFEIYKSRL